MPAKAFVSPKPLGCILWLLFYFPVHGFFGGLPPRGGKGVPMNNTDRPNISSIDAFGAFITLITLTTSSSGCSYFCKKKASRYVDSFEMAFSA